MDVAPEDAPEDAPEVVPDDAPEELLLPEELLPDVLPELPELPELDEELPELTPLTVTFRVLLVTVQPL